MRGSVDVLVVGCGVAGAATAYFAAKAGLKVALVEAERPAHGASGRNPGFLWLQTKSPGTAMDFSIGGRQFSDELARELPDFGFRACGGLLTYRDEEFADTARAFARDRCAAGLQVAHLDGQEARCI